MNGFIDRIALPGGGVLLLLPPMPGRWWPPLENAGPGSLSIDERRT